MSRGNRRRQQLEHTVAALEERHGAGVLRRASDVVKTVPHIPTGFTALDSATGCGGIPLGEMTLLSGISAATDGKVTIAYKTLANSQRAYPQQVVALVDLHATGDPDYLTRAGVDMERLLLAEPDISRQAVDTWLEPVRQPARLRVHLANQLAMLSWPAALDRLVITQAQTAELPALQMALFEEADGEQATIGELAEALKARYGAIFRRGLLTDATHPVPWRRAGARQRRQFDCGVSAPDHEH